jgi:RND family efflux transporter MFP subunit
MESTQLPTAPAPKRRPSSIPPDDFQTEPAPVLPMDDEGHAHDEGDIEVTPTKTRWLIGAAVIGVLALLTLLLVGLLPRQQNNKELLADAEAALNAPVPVNVIQPSRAPAADTISLPGNLRPWQEVSIFARTSGYLKDFKVDISNNVKAGQLMAEIETPEVDQQLRQAEATVLQTQAAAAKAASDLELAKVTYARYERLAGTGSVTAQDLDQKHSDMSVAQANVEAAKANIAAAQASVQRLQQMQNFQKVTAPFSGVVTGRAYDVGALILADPTDSNIAPMFKIAENDVLRVFVNVPQSSALQVRKGMEVKVTARELPNKTFTGMVMGTTNYLDQASRSLLTEVKVDNEKQDNGDFMLLPGMYVSVSFVIQRTNPPLELPAPALISGPAGNEVALAQNGYVHFVKVTLGKDYGDKIEIVSGLEGGEQVIANPGERITEGAPVKIVNDNK